MKRAWLLLLLIPAAAAVYWWPQFSGQTQHFFGFGNGDGNDSHYLFWSGVGSDLAYLSFLVAGLTLYRKHNCQMRWCWRIGRHEFADPADGVTRMLCWHHHPDVKHKNLTAERIGEIQHRRHLYLGKQPGKG